jgi:hypothetical protein
MKAVLVIAIATLSTGSLAQQSESESDEIRLGRAFMDHYMKAVAGSRIEGQEAVQGQCEGRLGLSDSGYLTSIELRCPSDEVRQATLRRLAAAVPFPPLPGGVREVWGSF